MVVICVSHEETFLGPILDLAPLACKRAPDFVGVDENRGFEW
jgi:hypothetical protein